MKTRFFTLFIFGFLACDPIADRKFQIINEEPYTVAYYFSKDSLKDDAEKYFFEASHKNANGEIIKVNYDFVSRKSKKNLPLMTDWETYIKQQFNGTAYLYLIDSIYVGKNKTQDKQFNLIRYRLTLDTLRQINWKITIR